MSKASFIMFIAGVGIGSAVAWVFAKKKYEQIAQEEIDSVKEVFAKYEKKSCEPTLSDVQEKVNQAKDKPEAIGYATKIHKQGYINYSDVGRNKPHNLQGINKEIEEESKDMETPYVISPDEFGEMDDYENISLVYYADNVLVDDDDVLMEDIDDVVGLDSLNHFGEYEEDSVFVRNDRLKCDYEILVDRRKYSDVINRKPHQVED